MKKNLLMQCLGVAIVCFAAAALPSTVNAKTGETLKVSVETYGMLEEKLSEYTEPYSTLVISGFIDESDFETIYDYIEKWELYSLDLTDAHPLHKRIPDFAFFNPDIQDPNNSFDLEQVKRLSLREIKLPDETEEFGEACFAALDLVEFEMPQNLKTLGRRSFCLTSIFRNIDIPEGVTVIPEECFDSADIQGVSLPASVTSVEYAAFLKCEAYKVVFSEGLQKIGRSAFGNMDNVSEVILPQSCTDLGIAAFYGCDRLERFEFGDDVEVIEGDILAACRALKEVKLPSNLRKIEASAFASTNSLREIAFPESVEEIELTAFYQSGLNFITFPASSPKLGRRAFIPYNTDVFRQITCLSSVPPAPLYPESTNAFYSGDSAFDGLTYYMPVYIPKGSLEAYKNAPLWSKFQTFIEFDDPSGIEYLTDSEIEVKAYRNLVVISVDMPSAYSIYSLDGRMVESGILSPGSTQVELQSGIYVVRAGAKVKKVRI